MNAKAVYLNKELQDDNVFVKSEVLDLATLANTQVRSGISKVIVSEGMIVNAVSPSYGHLPNENFFYKVEESLIDANIGYATRSINRDNRSFAVDYILRDESLVIKVKNSNDVIAPMLRFVNAYDGSAKTSGHLGFYRRVCMNGLHIAHTRVGFSVRHNHNISEIVLPQIDSLIQGFMDNEFYTLSRKFEVLAETPITDLKEFVKLTAEKVKLFTYASSEKNPEPGANARWVLDAINSEAKELKTEPNLWLGYNAFNAILHNKLKLPFDEQERMDSRLFDTVLEYAN